MIAAPIDLSGYMNSITSGTVVVDFREVPLEKNWSNTISYISFAEMLDSIRETEERTWQIRKMLQPFLDELVKERELEAQQFIFGWEELTCPAF